MCWCRIGSSQLDSGIIKSDSALTVLSRSSLYKHPQSTCQLLQQLAGRSPDCTCISTNTRLIISFWGMKGPNGSLKALIYILKGLNPPAAAELCLQKLHMCCSWFLVTLCVNYFFILFSGLGTLSTEGGFLCDFFIEMWPWTHVPKDSDLCQLMSGCLFAVQVGISAGRPGGRCLPDCPHTLLTDGNFL